MAGIIPGYEYEIFISYRQKDNMYDGWVTDFVSNLKREIEATFREEIRVYFDMNPRDGLLENYDVDDSLKQKLKCLVLIPIISRTYCDPKAFAWKHEFKAFIDLASKDQFGLKVKLASGNVASRVLPVRIYELGNSEVELCEAVAGGVLRGINFIYKSAGVNRPLRANEDHPGDNINKTYYRDQINKVANSIKEILDAFSDTQNKPVQNNETRILRPVKSKNIMRLTGSILLAVFIITGIILGSGILKSREEIERSIAVLPFNNDSPDEQNLHIVNGLMDEILISLQSIKDLRVISRNSVEQYRQSSRLSTPAIAKELGVSYIVEGSVQKYDSSLRLRVELIRAIGKEANLWAKSFNLEITDIKDIFSIQNEIAQSIADQLEIVITPVEKHLIEKAPTESLEAYNFYQRGREELLKYELDYYNVEVLKTARTYFRKALQYDPAFSQAYSGLALGYSLDKFYFSHVTTDLDSLFFNANQAIKYDEHNAEAYFVRSWYYYVLGESTRALEETDKALNLNPNYWEVYEFRARIIYMWDYKNQDFIKSIENFQKAISLNHGKDLPRLLRDIVSLLSGNAGFHDLSAIYNRKAFEIDNDSVKYLLGLSFIEMGKSNIKGAFEYGKQSYEVDSSSFETNLLMSELYMDLGQYDKAGHHFRWLKRYYSVTGKLPIGSMHRIAYYFWQIGDRKEAEQWFSIARKENEEAIESMFSDAAIGLNAYYDLAGILAFHGDKKKALENLRILTKRKVVPNWWVNLIKKDPLFNSIRSDPDFQNILTELESKYKAEHERVGKWLEQNENIYSPVLLQPMNSRVPD